MGRAFKWVGTALVGSMVGLAPMFALAAAAAPSQGQAQAQPQSPSGEVALTPAQRDALLRKTCTDPRSLPEVEIDARRPAGAAAAVTAIVLCPTRVKVRLNPAFRRSQCTLAAANEWACGQPVDAVRLPVQGQPVLISFDSARVPPAYAVEMAHYIGNEHPLTLNGRDLRWMMRRTGLCEMAPIGAGRMKDSFNYALTCGREGIVVTRFCVGTNCRSFPAEFRDPAP